MSSHPSTPRVRSWRTAAAVLAVVLLLVVAAGLWARWRLLSDDDAARLAARTTVESVRAQLHPESSASSAQAGSTKSPDSTAPADGSPRPDSALFPDGSLLPAAVLDRQLDELGPPATPTQTRRMAERGEEPPAVESLSDAAGRLADTADAVHDADLAASLAAVAASWWAADASSPASRAADPAAAGSAGGEAASGEAPGDGVGDDRAGDGPAADSGSPSDPATPSASAAPAGPEGCEPEQLAAVTAVDRAQFVAEAAQARISTGDAARADVDATVTGLHDALEDERAAGLLGCDPGPVAARYELPEGFTTDPARATGAAEREASEAVVRAVAGSPAGQRSWWLDVLQDTAHGAQRLDPQKPVAALPGRG
ncbi:hypothetical protein [Kocuria varians]|uniref:Uncharacterized protein n=1 Tax=Kocuria varians TaxID=1272 RepID=A0A7D7KYU5_KOCVA|nr:hypothetical protein [Kocuria varians]QMS56770.1 hypothetical protein CIB50_0001489 [Kocuria varians]